MQGCMMAIRIAAIGLDDIDLDPRLRIVPFRNKPEPRPRSSTGGKLSFYFEVAISLGEACTVGINRLKKSRLPFPADLVLSDVLSPIDDGERTDGRVGIGKTGEAETSARP
jgi:hypothetical protein